MFVVDDPMLALIVRFVAGDRDVDIRNDEFLQRQLKTILNYIGRFPEAEREARTLEWIQTNARRYRREWQRNAIASRLTDERCPDCPLIRDDEGSHCQIHERWLEILNEYANNAISSAQYVRDTLDLLEAHKARLKVTGIGGRPR